MTTVGSRALEVLATGPLATVQDTGRPGLAELGVGRSGAADRTALGLGNRLLGNPAHAAAIEVTLGGLRVRARTDLVVAVTGAPCPMSGPGPHLGPNSVTDLPAGATLRLGTPRTGLRSYLCVRGGVAVPSVLGSRSTDMLAGIGPEVLAAGSVLPVGPPVGRPPSVDSAPVPAPTGGTVELRVLPGPREDWFRPEALDVLAGSSYLVGSDSNRIGMRLRGPVLPRSRHEELPSEGMVPGALQVSASGLPTLLLADHPVTGGYPVIAVVVSADLPLAAQARPGQRLRFRVPAAPGA